ncbi:MAG: hypothetical protein GF375_00925 [Candidatus Omnitrophica bacterium]|nr:hypothetical protein [Candidatus Omnitrophota bacterium]
MVDRISKIQDRIAKRQENIFIRLGKLEKQVMQQENMLIILAKDLDERLAEEDCLENCIMIQ